MHAGPDRLIKLIYFLTTATEFTVLFEPSAAASLETFTSTKSYLVLEILDTVKSKYAFWRYVTEDGAEGAGRWVFCGEEACEWLLAIADRLFS